MTKQVPMDARMRLEFVSWIHTEWSKAFDALKHAKELPYLKSVDGDRLSYEISKKEMIATATEKFNYWSARLKEYKEFSPLVEQLRAEND